MSSRTLLSRVGQRIHLVDKDYLEPREVHLEWLGDGPEADDDMATLAFLRFSVSASELERILGLGLIEESELDTKSGAGDVTLVFRTDRDLLDEEDDEFRSEWERLTTEPESPLELWADLDLWEFQSTEI